jgi:hypothetical protein
MDANGYSIGGAYQAPFWGLPDFGFDTIMTRLESVFPSTFRHNVSVSDATFIPVNALFATANNVTMMRWPLDWFYTVAADENNSLITLMLTQDAVHWYSPKQSGNLIDMMRSYADALPGFSMIPSMNPQTLSQFLFNNLASGPNATMSFDQIMAISMQDSDPMTAMIRKSIESRYPSGYSFGYGGCYDPLCYGVNTYAMGPDSNAQKSWQTAVVINRFVGAVRHLPEYIVPIHINPKLIMATPPTYSNPYTATFAAFQTMEEEKFLQFVYSNPDLVKHDLSPGYVHKSNKRENTTRELIEQKLGKDFDRRVLPVTTPLSLFEETMKGYERQTKSITRAEKEVISTQRNIKMTETLEKAGL